MTAKCHGTDYGYICHLAKLCRHVSPDATVSDPMLCEHLGFEHFMSHPSTTYGQISQAIREAEKRRGPEVVVALKREYARMMPPRQPEPKPAPPGVALHAAWNSPIGQTMDLFA